MPYKQCGFITAKVFPLIGIIAALILSNAVVFCKDKCLPPQCCIEQVLFTLINETAVISPVRVWCKRF